MKFPKKIRIMGVDFSVTYHKDGVETDHDRKIDCRGSIQSCSSSIRIQKKQNKVSMVRTLIHEIIHGIDTEVGAGLNERSTRILACGLVDSLNSCGLLRVPE